MCPCCMLVAAMAAMTSVVTILSRQAGLAPVALAELEQLEAVLQARDQHLLEARHVDSLLSAFPQRQVPRLWLQQVLQCSVTSRGFR